MEEGALTRVLAIATACVALAAPAIADEASGISFASGSAVWDGMLHVSVHCAGTSTCTGDMTAGKPGDTAVLVESEYEVAAGKTSSVLLDPGGSASRTIAKLSSIDVKVMPAPQGSQPIEATLKVVHKTTERNPAPAKPLGPRTKFQFVKDKRGDSRDTFTHMDIVGASARRKGRIVVFTVTTAHPPPNIHDGFGNPAAPCLEIPFKLTGSARNPYPMQTCGDAKLRGYKRHYWPNVRFSISGRTSTWKIPLKLLPKRAFRWRAYVADGYHYRDVAPNRGYKLFIR